MASRGFTASESFQAQESGESIMLGVHASRIMCEDHSTSLEDYLKDSGLECGISLQIDSADLLAWLGY